MFNRYLRLITLLFFILSSCEPTVSSPSTGATPPLEVQISYSNDQTLNTYTFNANSVGSIQLIGFEWEINDVKHFSKTVTYTFTEAKSYLIRLKATDSDGRVDSIAISINVKLPLLNTAPVADFEASVNGFDVTFDAAKSFDIESDIKGYLWTVEGQSYTTKSFTHTYTQTGSFDVKLVVSDIAGLTSDISKSVLIKSADIEPTAHIVHSSNGLSVRFNASGSDGYMIKYEWLIEGLSYNKVSHNHTFSAEGSFDVVLTVTDNNGLKNQAFITVDVNLVELDDSVNPIADFEFDVEGFDVSFDGALSYDLAGDILEYEWLIEQQNYSGVTQEHSFTAIDSYEVQLTVTDENGNTDFIIKTVDVIEELDPNRAPVAMILKKVNGDAYISLDASNSYDQDRDELIYTWELSDGGVFNGVNFIYEADSTASIDAVLTVSDGKDFAQANYVFNPGSSSINRPYELELYDAVTSYLSCAARCHSENHPFSQDYSLNNSDEQIRGLITKYGADTLYKYPVGLSNHQGNTVINGGTDPDKWKNLVRLVDADVNAINLPVDVDFSYEITNKTVIFTNTSIDPENEELSFEWDFGDLMTDTNEHNIHTFKENSDYIIKLTVSDGYTYQSLSKKIEL